MFHQTLTCLFPSSVNWFFLVQLTDLLARIVYSLTFILNMPWCRGSPPGTSSHSSSRRWHWSSSCPIVDFSVFHPQILESVGSFFWNNSLQNTSCLFLLHVIFLSCVKEMLLLLQLTLYQLFCTLFLLLLKYLSFCTVKVSVYSGNKCSAEEEYIICYFLHLLS